MKLAFRKANSRDAAAIAALVNSAYRGESSRQGWTTEADLLDGLRTETCEVQQLIETASNLILLCLNDNELLGSICLEQSGESAYLGMFAIAPRSQGQGIGKQLLAYAECMAIEYWSPQRMVMSVITHREELIAFYQRRGYRRTGIFKPFPAQSPLWTPLVAELQLELLEKPLTV